MGLELKTKISVLLVYKTQKLYGIHFGIILIFIKNVSYVGFLLR